VALSPVPRETIARRFLPSRWHYHYVRSKLSTDPLFVGVAAALHGCEGELLDLGCGIGLLAHYLDERGLRITYLGFDNDPRKIAQARAAAARGGLAATFEQVDLAACVCAASGRAFDGSALAHRGHVAILDVLQFLPPLAQEPLLREVAACIAPGARLVIRTGLADRGWRARVTRAVDWLSRALRWMNTGPKAYPEREVLAALLSGLGLRVTFSPLWGGTPFNNWLVVAERAAVGNGSSGSTQR
jgi:2-polyprenyl-3-methyl-5-hydroxy-6-metoxy-1,4-benzoquinol methylase